MLRIYYITLNLKLKKMEASTNLSRQEESFFESKCRKLTLRLNQEFRGQFDFVWRLYSEDYEVYYFEIKTYEAMFRCVIFNEELMTKKLGWYTDTVPYYSCFVIEKKVYFKETMLDLVSDILNQKGLVYDSYDIHEDGVIFKCYKK